MWPRTVLTVMAGLVVDVLLWSKSLPATSGEFFRAAETDLPVDCSKHELHGYLDIRYRSVVLTTKLYIVIAFILVLVIVSFFADHRYYYYYYLVIHVVLEIFIAIVQFGY